MAITAFNDGRTRARIESTGADDAGPSAATIPPLPADLTPVPPAAAGWFRAPAIDVGPRSDSDRLSGYQLRREVGRGAMGVVYEAEQLDLKRLVAVKVLHPAAPLSSEALFRFRGEAQAAARLCHPNIVAVHGVGESDGRPFLVMEYVAGGSLAAQLARAPLPAQEAAALVATIAAAVEHSHCRGVVHRDLKPANVLIAADGIPKVTDFGLAKLLDADAGQTQSGMVIGTPAYMAPEQAAGGPAAAKPPADIYALGIILYECLTGRPPFRSASTAETLHLIRTADPVPPRRLAPHTPRDLETIALTCLDKDPSRRYPTAAALAADLDRFLDGRPITARPAGALTRIRKWCRRRPAWAALIGFAMFAVIAGGAGGVAFTARLQREADRATRGEDEALRQMNRADGNYLAARAALQRMLDRLREDHRDLPAMKDLQRAQAEDALAFFLAVAGREDGRPDVRYDAARAGQQAAQLQMVLGRWPDAETNLDRSREQLAALAAEAPDRLDYNAELARTLNELGSLRGKRHTGPAPPCLTEALAYWEALVAAHPGSIEYRDGLATCHHVLGNYFFERAVAGEAMHHYRAAADLRERLLAEQPGSRDLSRRLAQSLVNLSVMLQQVPFGIADAQAAHDRAEGHFEQLLRDEPDELETLGNLAIMRMNWAYVLSGRGQNDAALADLGKNVASLEPVLKKEPAAIHARNALYRTYGTRAVLLERVSRHKEAVVDWERTLALAAPADQAACRASLAAARERAGGTAPAKD